MKYFFASRHSYESGQVAIVAVIFFLLISLVTLGSFAALGINQFSEANELLYGKKAYATLESGVEDLTLRTLKGWYLPTNAGLKETNLSLNGGTAVTTLAHDGTLEAYPKQYKVTAKADVSKRYRKIVMDFEVPDSKLAVSVKSAIQAGYLGIKINSDAQIHSTYGYNKGDIFSNGSFVSTGGNIVVNGNAAIAKGISNIVQQAHNHDFSGTSTMSGCTNCGLYPIDRYTTTPPQNPVDGSRARDGAQSFVANITAPSYQVDLLLGHQGSGYPTSGFTVQIRDNKRVRNGANGSGGTVCSIDDYGVDFIDGNGDGEFNTGEVRPTDCVDMPDPGVSAIVASRGLLIGDFSGKIPNLGNANSGVLYWFPVVFTTQGTIYEGKKYWIVIDDGCSNQCLSNDANYWVLGGRNDGLGIDYTYGNDQNNTPNTSWWLETQATRANLGDKGGFFSFRDWTNTTADEVFIGIGRTTRPFDIGFRVYMGELQTRIDGTSVPANVDTSPSNRVSFNTQGNQPLIVGDAAAQRMRAVDIGGVAYYEDLDPAQPQGEVKAGGDTLSYDPVTKLKISHAGPYYDASGYYISPTLTSGVTATPYANYTDIDKNTPIKWHDIGINQYICIDDFKNLNASFPSYLQGQSYRRHPTASNIQHKWGAACDAPRYAANDRWMCWDFFCSCNNSSPVAGAGSNVIADKNGSDSDSNVNDEFCEQAGEANFPAGKIPDPRNAFGLDGDDKVMSATKLQELKAKAMSLGVFDATYLPQDTLTLSSALGYSATTTIPGVAPWKSGVHPAKYSGLYARDFFQTSDPVPPTHDEFVSVGGTGAGTGQGVTLYGGYIRGNVTLAVQTGIRVAGRITQDTYNEYYAAGKPGATTTPQANLVDKCPYNLRHYAATDSRHDEPCYVLWITGDLTITGSEVTLTGLPPPGACTNVYGKLDSSNCDLSKLDYSIYIIVEGRILMQQKSHMYGFPHPSERAGLFMVSLAPKSTDGTPAIDLNGNVKGSAFFAYRGSINTSNNVQAKALVAERILTAGNSKIFFDEGLRSPFSDTGGSQLTGANIKDYYESQ